MERAQIAKSLIAERVRRLQRIGPRLVDSIAPERRVDRYWTRHMVRADEFKSSRESADYLEWRFEEYPLFREFSGLWGDHSGETILDYGCGPGNDVVGFLIHTDAARVIGMDVSSRALEATRRRLRLHDPDPGRVELVRISDSEVGIPLEDDSIDFFQSQGVLHHTSDPEGILREIHRVLRPGGEGRVMVYNRDSVWFHLFVAYMVKILDGLYPELDDEEAFQRTTDGPDCPIARCYRPGDFIALCDGAGFEAEFLGGYLSKHELGCIDEHLEGAIADERLAPGHREFLRELERDGNGYPTWRGKHAGIGGSYVLRSRASGA